MRNVIFPLNQLRFPALVNLEELSILMEATPEQTVRVIRSIDYPTMLPVLEKVEIVVFNEDDEIMYVNPWGENATAPVQSQKYSPSKTVKSLTLDLHFDHNSLETCGKIFTNVSHLTLIPNYSSTRGNPIQRFMGSLVTSGVYENQEIRY